ncbi:MAG TPA: CaiB/BaiF CoA-transferase family protein [Mycobacterium sp.]|uniref:CaiB/BaiF CoA transferase family protein n=1 Tax=Mycobacterium sp. TaxID=1785 RepID=UPI002F42501F
MSAYRTPAEAKPLSGVRILAIEQMQALPFATQLLARLGADVVKVESVNGGDQARGSLPAIADPQGRRVGATFLRNNLNKRSVCIDLKSPAGRDLVLSLAKGFDVVAENGRPGSMDRLGLGYNHIAEVNPRAIYVSVSGFGNTVDTPYRDWPAFAPVVEAMSGLYEMKRVDGHPPQPAPAGALGDIGAALFATIGILAALRHREMTGAGQYVDIAMLDSVVAITDIITNFWSMGTSARSVGQLILRGFQAKDGWFMLQVGREHHFERLANLIGHPEWLQDPRLASRQGWVDHMDDVIVPAIEGWAVGMTKIEVCHVLAQAGIAAGPCLRDDEVAADPHLAARQMLVQIKRDDQPDRPVLVPASPVRLSAMIADADEPVPWLGQHTDEVLQSELGLGADELSALRTHQVIA